MTYTIASIQTTEALKILLDKEYCKDLIYIDLWDNDFKKIKVNKDPDCPAC
ncbi:MAG: hypothetical protein KAT43_02070 [Nanoarchaeota archaeon]|nr:hypothetical protein [Nanoarchaeota archaeon]